MMDATALSPPQPVPTPMTQRGEFADPPPRGALFSSLTALHTASTADELEAARVRAATSSEARERNQQRRADAACPSLRQAMQTLAEPFDAKQAALPTAHPTRSQRHSRRASSLNGLAFSDALTATESLRDALDRKARELGNSDSSAAAVSHFVAAAPSVAAAAPSATGSASGLSAFRDTMRGMLHQSQSQRDRDVDAMAGAGEGKPAPDRSSPDGSASRVTNGQPHRSRVDLADLIDIEDQLDAEFGPIVSAAMRPSAAQPTEARTARQPSDAAPVQRSKQSSARSSRKSLMADVASSLGFQLVTVPADPTAAASHAPVAPSSASLGSKVRAGRDAQSAQPISSLLQRQRTVESATTRDASAQLHTVSRVPSGSVTSRTAIMSRRNTFHASPAAFANATSTATSSITAAPVLTSRSAASSRRSTLVGDGTETTAATSVQKQRGPQDAPGGKAFHRTARTSSSGRTSAPPSVSAVPHRDDFLPSRTFSPSRLFGTAEQFFAAPSVSGSGRPLTARAFTIHNKTTLSSFMKTKPPVFAVDMPIASARSAHSSPSRSTTSAVKRQFFEERPAAAAAFDDDDESEDSADEADSAHAEEAVPLPGEEPQRPKYNVSPSLPDRSSASASNVRSARTRRQTAPPGQAMPLPFRGVSRSGASSPNRQLRGRSTATSVNHSRAVSPTPVEFPSRSCTVSPFFAPHPPSHGAAAAGVAEGRKRLSNGSTATAGASSGSLRPTPPKHPATASQPLSRRTSFSLAEGVPPLVAVATAVLTVAEVLGGKVVLAPLPRQHSVEPVAEAKAPDLPSPDPSASKLPALDSAPSEQRNGASFPGPVADSAQNSLVPAQPNKSGEESTGSLHSAASSTISTGTDTSAASTASSRGASTSGPSHQHASQLIEEQISAEIVELETLVKERIREHNKWRHAGNSKADHMVALTRQLTLLDDALARERDERAQGCKAAAAKEAELTELLVQHESLQLENAQIERETRELHKRHLVEEKTLIDHRALSHQLEQRIMPAQHKLGETRSQTAAMVAECAGMREMFAARARRYAADLAEQKRNAETLEMLCAARERPHGGRSAPLKDEGTEPADGAISAAPEPTPPDDDALADASDSPAPPSSTAVTSSPSHEQLLWQSRMSVIQAATGLDDFLAFARQVQSQPGARAESLREQQRLQARLKGLEAERIQLAKLLGMKRIAAINLARNFAGGASGAGEPAPPSIPPAVSSPLDPLMQSALSKLAAVEARLSSAQPKGTELTRPTASRNVTEIEPAALLRRVQLEASRVMASRAMSSS